MIIDSIASEFMFPVSQEVFCGSCGIWYKLLSLLAFPAWGPDRLVLALACGIFWNQRIAKEVKCV